MCSYIQGPEKAVIALLAEEHIDERTGKPIAAVYIDAMLAKFPKPVRAQKTAELWNEGRIVVPPTRSWTGEFVERMKRFTGAPGQDDNDTDALVSAIDYLEAQAPTDAKNTGAYQRTRG
jgi:phage terminase large subunit-like protein